MSRVGLITGGVGSEREISLLSARGVADSLTELGHEVYLFDYPQDRHKLVRHVDQLAFVMIILHGK
jgi:D-alanine-D-alanine ligase